MERVSIPVAPKGMLMPHQAEQGTWSWQLPAHPSAPARMTAENTRRRVRFAEPLP